MARKIKTFFGQRFSLYDIVKYSVNCPTNTGKTEIHSYGNGPFCKFDCPSAIKDKRGLYVFVIDGKVKYLGRCLTTYKQRIQQGYGRISPDNCSKVGGQPTNCHVNIELNKAFASGKKVQIGILPMESKERIPEMERQMISKMRQQNPFWNLQY